MIELNRKEKKKVVVVVHINSKIQINTQQSNNGIK